jgi:hypothetical protein
MSAPAHLPDLARIVAPEPNQGLEFLPAHEFGHLARITFQAVQLLQEIWDLTVTEVTGHPWRNQYGGLKASDAKRLKELEKENTALKRILADKDLEIDAVKEVARGNGEPVPGGAKR